MTKLIGAALLSLLAACAVEAGDSNEPNTGDDSEAAVGKVAQALSPAPGSTITLTEEAIQIVGDLYFRQVLHEFDGIMTDYADVRNENTNNEAVRLHVEASMTCQEGLFSQNTYSSAWDSDYILPERWFEGSVACPGDYPDVVSITASYTVIDTLLLPN